MTQLWWVIVLGGIVTFAIRASSLLVAERFTGLPPRVETALRMIPPAALAALIAPALLRPDGGGFELINPMLAGGLGALSLALWKRTVLGPLLLGFAITTVVGLLLR
jgi:branched-subunit amino acid transport protein